MATEKACRECRHVWIERQLGSIDYHFCYQLNPYKRADVTPTFWCDKFELYETQDTQ